MGKNKLYFFFEKTEKVFSSTLYFFRLFFLTQKTKNPFYFFFLVFPLGGELQVFFFLIFKKNFFTLWGEVLGFFYWGPFFFSSIKKKKLRGIFFNRKGGIFKKTPFPILKKKNPQKPPIWVKDIISIVGAI